MSVVISDAIEWMVELVRLNVRLWARSGISDNNIHRTPSHIFAYLHIIDVWDNCLVCHLSFYNGILRIITLINRYLVCVLLIAGHPDQTMLKMSCRSFRNASVRPSSLPLALADRNWPEIDFMYQTPPSPSCIKHTGEPVVCACFLDASLFCTERIKPRPATVFECHCERVNVFEVSDWGCANIVHEMGNLYNLHATIVKIRPLTDRYAHTAHNVC